MGMNRREAIKLVATASVALWTPEEAVAARAKAAAVLSQSRGGVPFEPEFFNAHEYDTVRLLVDLVIPADDRSGSATEAGVPEFMDFMIDNDLFLEAKLRFSTSTGFGFTTNFGGMLF